MSIFRHITRTLETPYSMTIFHSCYEGSCHRTPGKEELGSPGLKGFGKEWGSSRGNKKVGSDRSSTANNCGLRSRERTTETFTKRRSWSVNPDSFVDPHTTCLQDGLPGREVREVHSKERTYKTVYLCHPYRNSRG